MKSIRPWTKERTKPRSLTLCPWNIINSSHCSPKQKRNTIPQWTRPPLHFHQPRRNLTILRRNQPQRPRLHLARTLRARIPIICCYSAKIGVFQVPRVQQLDTMTNAPPPKHLKSPNKRRILFRHTRYHTYKTTHLQKPSRCAVPEPLLSPPPPPGDKFLHSLTLSHKHVTPCRHHLNPPTPIWTLPLNILARLHPAPA
jgi:hypothetical protein